MKDISASIRPRPYQPRLRALQSRLPSAHGRRARVQPRQARVAVIVLPVLLRWEVEPALGELDHRPLLRRERRIVHVVPTVGVVHPCARQPTAIKGRGSRQRKSKSLERTPRDVFVCEAARSQRPGWSDQEGVSAHRRACASPRCRSRAPCRATACASAESLTTFLRTHAEEFLRTHFSENSRQSPVCSVTRSIGTLSSHAACRSVHGESVQPPTPQQSLLIFFSRV